MTATASAPTQPTHPASQAEPSQPDPAAESNDAADTPAVFQAALEVEVARRIDAVERRWQSRKDRELHRARRRWESEAGQDIDPELLAWIADADPREIGQWLKTGLTDQEPASPEPEAARTSQPEAPAASDDSPASQPVEAGTQSPRSDAGDAPASTPVGHETDGQTAEQASPVPDVEREAEARERLAERRSQDPSPDLFPSRGAPADAFQQIEAGFARGEVDLETYETARRRRGLT